MPLIPRRRVGRLGIFLGGRACARTLAVALTLAVGPGSPPARAAEGLYLTWNDCAAGAGVPSLTGGCGSNAGDQRLYLAFTLGAPLDEVLGIEAVVDLQAGTTALPDWWHFEPANPGLGQPAGCRFGSLSASQDYTGHAACVDPWLNRGTPLIQGYTPGDPRGGTAQARIKVVETLPAPFVASLTAGPMVHGVIVVIDNQKTSGAGFCAGCLTRVCLVLNSIWIRRTLDATGGDQLLVQTVTPGSNWAVWQQGTALDCTAVPVRRATWGQIKSLYR